MIFKSKQVNKRWEKRPQLYKGRFYYFRKLAQALLFGLLICGALGVVWYFRNSETLTLKTVSLVSETKHVKPAELIALSGLTPEDKLFKVSLTKIAQNIGRHPWVKEVKVRREFPDKIQIHVTERTPYLYVVAGDTYIADNTGTLFKRKDPSENYSLPVVTGFTKDLAENYPQMAKLDLDEALHFYETIRHSNFYKSHPLAQIHFDRSLGFTVFTERHTLEIFYGKNNLKNKQSRLEELDKVQNTLSPYFSRLDLNRDDRIIARKRL